MNMIDYPALTKQYYAQWLGVERAAMDRPGVIAHCSALRDARQKGYSRPFPLYCWISRQTGIVSYSKSIEASVGAILGSVKGDLTSGQAIDEIKSSFPTVRQGKKFVFGKLPDEIDSSRTVQLTRQDYPAFMKFQLEQYPQPTDMDWLEPYYNSLVDRGYVFGVFVDDHLVSATDAPDMPFMDDQVVEIGINTLKDYRGRGYAKTVVAGLIRHLIKQGMVPLWSCVASNEASRALALSVGFRELAQTIYT
jgi:RimJ/RimL family protein N-acetyltransferase